MNQSAIFAKLVASVFSLETQLNCENDCHVRRWNRLDCREKGSVCAQSVFSATHWLPILYFDHNLFVILWLPKKFFLTAPTMSEYLQNTKMKIEGVNYTDLLSEHRTVNASYYSQLLVEEVSPVFQTKRRNEKCNFPP